MHDWQHVVARWILAGAVFLLACAASAPLSMLVWQARRRLSAVGLKGIFSFLLLLPLGMALFVLLSYSLPSCFHRQACYIGWLLHAFGEGALIWMRPVAMLVGGMLLVSLVGLVYRTATVVRTVRGLVALSSPPSPKLANVLRQVVPHRWHARFRQVEMSPDADGVYGGVCLLSHETVRSLSEGQLKAVVAHEYQHLRARDGWFALCMGLLASSLGLRAWNTMYRYWSSAAELLADARTTQQGVARRELARTLLDRQVAAQGVVLGFSSRGTLLDERMQRLLTPVPESGLAQVLWALVLVCAGGLLYTVWQTSTASTCTIHCLLF